MVGIRLELSPLYMWYILCKRKNAYYWFDRDFALNEELEVSDGLHNGTIVMLS